MKSVEPVAEMPTAAEAYTEELREKILFGLSIYPFLSPTMIHVFLGTSTPASIWKEEVLTQLIEEGKVVQRNVPLTSPSGRSQNYTVLHLANSVYIPPSPNSVQLAEETPTSSTSPLTDSEAQEATPA